MDPKDRLIVALDVDSEKKALEMVDKLKSVVKIFKVGLELFSSCGPGIVETIKKRGFDIFLDLKLHDIPNTVSKTAASLTRLGVFMFNVHALGGYDMMEKTSDTVRDEANRLKIPRPKILAVTILTSMDEFGLKKVGIRDTIEKQLFLLARLARASGLDGVVASGREVKLLKEEFGKDLLVVTPGVRPLGAAKGGQRRVATPREAIEDGADYIVVGRPIIESDDPMKAAENILKEIGG